MHRHLDDELKSLKAKILRMGGLVEEQVQGALRALVERDADLARKMTAWSTPWMWRWMRTPSACSHCNSLRRGTSDSSPPR